jgi:RNA polymerase sigma-70 factor (ECF subfamily)
MTNVTFFRKFLSIYMNAMDSKQKIQPQRDNARLVARCLAGDKRAFAALIDRHRARLERLLRTTLSDWLEIEDVWQDTVLRAYLNLEQLRDPARFGAWLCSIAINLARTRRSAAFPNALSWEALDSTAMNDVGWPDHEQPSPESVVTRHDLANRVHEAIADLPPAEREAVVLIYLNELSHKEAAEELGSSLSAVKVRVHRGRRRLHTALRNEFAPTRRANYQHHNLHETRPIRQWFAIL